MCVCVCAYTYVIYHIWSNLRAAVVEARPFRPPRAQTMRAPAPDLRYKKEGVFTLEKKDLF